MSCLAFLLPLLKTRTFVLVLRITGSHQVQTHLWGAFWEVYLEASSWASCLALDEAPDGWSFGEGHSWLSG